MNHEPECEALESVPDLPAEICRECQNLILAYQRGRMDERKERASKFGAWHDHEIEMPW